MGRGPFKIPRGTEKDKEMLKSGQPISERGLEADTC